MNKIGYLFIALFILAFGYSISNWVNKPLQVDGPHSDGSKNCVSCHKNSLSQEAWNGVPDWHNKEFRNPGLNAENREEHRREAHRHKKECMTCHAPHFQAKCANCHTQNEW